jgi:hypothetical protein
MLTSQSIGEGRAGRISKVLLLGCLVVACRPRSVRSNDDPAYVGQVISASFNVSSTGPGGLERLYVRSRTPGQPPVAMIRIDSTTRFAVRRPTGTASTPAGYYENLRLSHIRVWLKGPPTSLTAEEMWGNGRLILIDSLGVAPTRAP